MTTRSTKTLAWALTLAVGATAWARAGQDSKPAEERKGDSAPQDGASQKSRQDESSQKSRQDESSRKTEKNASICGEVAGVTVVGETLIDHQTGRGVLAEFTYLTILGSPKSETQGDGQRSRAEDRGRPKQSDASNESDRPKAQRTGRDARSSDRRNVYLIAVRPDTLACREDASGGEGSGGKNAEKKPSRQESQSALSTLELGDWVEVEFNRVMPASEAKPGGEGEKQADGQTQGSSANASRHGRHRVVRGIAESITILASSDQGGQKPGHGSDSSASNGSDSKSGEGEARKTDR